MKKINSLSGYIYEYQKSVATPESFWEELAESFYWRKRWDETLEWSFDPPSVNWFKGGKLNLTENIFERRIHTHKDKTAIIWEPNDPTELPIRITYQELFEKVQAVANVLLLNGVKKGDRVTIYMPMIPEIAIAMLACVRIGAIHTVVFAGFSAIALSQRIRSSGSKVLLTANGYGRGTKTVPMKSTVDTALQDCPHIYSVIVVDRLKDKENTPWDPRKDRWWDEELKKVPCVNEATVMDAEDPLFILYTSGSTGQPKGVVHTTGGYMVYTTFSFTNVFQYLDGYVHFCSADAGWITGHSYIIYGPLLAGSTTVLFEGIPTFPDAGRYWEIIEKHNVNMFYTAPTAIRSLVAKGLQYVENRAMSSLKVLGTVGEPINSEAWHWFHVHVGKERCPVVDTWWQTETGGIMIAPIAGVVPTKPTYATLPLPGIQPVIVDEAGKELKGNSVEGNLCIRFPWPGMARTIWEHPDRYEKSYFSDFKGLYFTGDGAKRDEDGYYRILGRVDDVINVSGHRFGTAELENAINEHPAVNEVAVIGYPHPVKGEGIYAFVVYDNFELKKREEITENLLHNIVQGVVKRIGPIAKPDVLQMVQELPKTRSGKIMRRILKALVLGERTNFGDTSTLLNPQSIQSIIGVLDAPRKKDTAP